jgi:hypothetical protein
LVKRQESLSLLLKPLTSLEIVFPPRNDAFQDSTMPWWNLFSDLCDNALAASTDLADFIPFIDPWLRRIHHDPDLTPALRRLGARAARVPSRLEGVVGG